MFLSIMTTIYCILSCTFYFNDLMAKTISVLPIIFVLSYYICSISTKNKSKIKPIVYNFCIWKKINISKVLFSLSMKTQVYLYFHLMKIQSTQFWNNTKLSTSYQWNCVLCLSFDSIKPLVFIKSKQSIDWQWKFTPLNIFLFEERFLVIQCRTVFIKSFSQTIWMM